MGCMLRSDPMTMCDVYLQPESAFEILSMLGEVGCVQFHDMNEGVQAFQRQYVTEICRCAEMERRLRYIEEEMIKDKIYVPDLAVQPKAMEPSEVRLFESMIEKWESDIVEMSTNQVNLMKNYLRLKEMYCILETIGPFLGIEENRREYLAKKGGDIDDTGRLVILTGVVQRQRCYSFEMMLWRLTHGNIYYRIAENDEILKDPFTGKDIRKVAFLVVGQGERLKSRMEKVCTGFRVNLYPCPTSHSERAVMSNKLHSELEDLESETMETSVTSFMSKVDTKEVPPTFHRTNKFTNGFQALINAYGDSCYRELNPALYTIITFPFLFSLMFGDVGHGFIMFVAAAWMLKNEKRFMEEHSTNEIWNIFFGGRYIILLMSLFSIWAGLIYNDLFSKGVIFQKSAWHHVPYTIEEIGEEVSLNLEIRDYGTAYAFGVDPLWKLGENKILFENSLKMKLSIIIGVIHMIFGLSLSLFNNLYFKRHYLIFLEFIPQMLFLCCLFFWLVILIYMKWFQYGGRTRDLKTGAGCAPLILVLFIDMMLLSTSQPVDEGCDAYMFKGQKTLQMVLVFLALVTVPIMLFGPPCFAHQSNKKKKVKLQAEVRKYAGRDEGNPNAKYLEEELEKVSKPFSDLMMHQAVHTIEFVLSTISHTASYLRLWALSLAHAQLSEMLWIMVFSNIGLQDTSKLGILKIVLVFAIWATFSLAILVLMEGLSAFLHTLRLHWVEFMSKFYQGCGYVFRPFSFKAILEDPSKDKQEVCTGAKARQDV